MELISSCNAPTSTPLLQQTLKLLIHKNQAAKVKLLIGRGCSANQPFEDLDDGTSVTTPLEEAALAKNIEIAGILLDHGAEIEYLVKYDSTALMKAAVKGQKEMVLYLIRSNANIDATSGGSYGSALHAAIQSGNEDTVNILLDAGANVGIRGFNPTERCSSLQAVLYLDHYFNGLGLAERLIELGADVNANDGSYGSPLQLAAAKGHLSMVQLLLDRGADIHLEGGDYGNALQAALDEEHEAVASLLREKGAVALRSPSISSSSSSASGWVSAEESFD